MSRHAPLLLALSCALAACKDIARPTPPVLTDPVALEVELLTPMPNEILIAGRTVPIDVRAREARGRVHGLGFVARRSGGDLAVVDSGFVNVGPLADTTVTFQMHLPSTLPTGSQVDVYGFALGPTGESRFSAPRPVSVYVCRPNALWC